ncbi:hypothetical protein M878_41505 [Streptomyces roseochromogenus subsp. oscitans DS 12.976]|uniref:Major facilitator superfamily (MFS) profile domain-containing protein n=1 Tax=Streptomyces roseochromogenus subsp. oscitans DS 12.976 TaxID=1352936 RepID=V6JS71_STRRC|nr:hypothetical protein M878_41505 [Streptomyces roseochromogenus subsp. oscitans DS 12.976]
MVAVPALAAITVSLMQTPVIPIIPELPSCLHASASDAAWAVTATLLAAAVATPVAGRLGDMFGKRRLLLVSWAPPVTRSGRARRYDGPGPLRAAPPPLRRPWTRHPLITAPDVRTPARLRDGSPCGPLGVRSRPPGAAERTTRRRCGPVQGNPWPMVREGAGRGRDLQP